MDFNHELIFHFNLSKAFLDGHISYTKFERNFLTLWNDFNEKYEFQIPENNKALTLLELRNQIFVALDSCTRRTRPNREYGEITIDEFKEILSDYYQDFLNVKFFFLSKAS